MSYKSEGQSIYKDGVYFRDGYGTTHTAAIVAELEALRGEIEGLTHERDVAREACAQVTAFRDGWQKEAEGLRERAERAEALVLAHLAGILPADLGRTPLELAAPELEAAILRAVDATDNNAEMMHDSLYQDLRAALRKAGR